MLEKNVNFDEFDAGRSQDGQSQNYKADEENEAAEGDKCAFSTIKGQYIQTPVMFRIPTII